MFSEEALVRAGGYSYARQVRTRRGAQDLVYRMFAIAAIEQYCDAFPENAETLHWFLSPKRRHTLLTELGRIAQPRSNADGVLEWNPDDVERLIQVALEVGAVRPTTKHGAAMVRARRSLRARGGPD